MVHPVILETRRRRTHPDSGRNAGEALEDVPALVWRSGRGVREGRTDAVRGTASTAATTGRGELRGIKDVPRTAESGQYHAPPLVTIHGPTTYQQHGNIMACVSGREAIPGDAGADGGYGTCCLGGMGDVARGERFGGGGGRGT